MIRFVLFALALSCGAPAFADDTILRLAEAATIMVAPDELAATLRAEAIAPNAQEAQRKVNETMREAVASAKKIDGITVATGGYSVWRMGVTPAERVERWQAGQSLNLTGRDAETMLRLVGELQQRGLVQGSLGWRLSRESERRARKEATKQALATLRGRADEAAEILGLRFSSFREVRLDNVTPPPIMPRQAMVNRTAMASTAPPPSAEAEDVPVSATAEADIVLKTK